MEWGEIGVDYNASCFCDSNCHPIQFISVVSSANGEIGDYGCFRNCSFQNNSATDFGAAIAVSSALVLSNREMFTPMDILNW